MLEDIIYTVYRDLPCEVKKVLYCDSEFSESVYIIDGEELRYSIFDGEVICESTKGWQQLFVTELDEGLCSLTQIVDSSGRDYTLERKIPLHELEAVLYDWVDNAPDALRFLEDMAPIEATEPLPHCGRSVIQRLSDYFYRKREVDLDSLRGSIVTNGMILDALTREGEEILEFIVTGLSTDNAALVMAGKVQGILGSLRSVLEAEFEND